MKALCIAVVSVLLVGCASITMDENQLVRVDAKTQAGEVVEGASCSLRNSRFDAEIKSGGSARVRRSSDDLAVKCKAAGLPDADGTAISRANAGLAGNILFGGGIGAIIDHNSGKAYSYPTWMQLIFGENRVFDRSKDTDGKVNFGVAAGTAAGQPTQEAKAVQVPTQAPMQAAPSGYASAPAPLAAQVPAAVVQQTSPSPAQAPVTSPSNARRMANVEDATVVPYVGSRAKQAYAEWLTKPHPRAFALSDRGHWAAAWGDSPADQSQAKDPSARALAACAGQTGVKCRLYAVDGQVVWQ